MTQLTHSDLVEIAARWLRRDYPVVATEIATHSREEPDAIGFTYKDSCLVECKTSRADFLADRRKRKRWATTRRIGMGRRRFYLCQPGTIRKEDLPEKWGLLVVRKSRVFCEYPAGFVERDIDAETGVLLSVIRRLGIKSEAGVSISVYTIPTGNRTGLHVRQEALDLKAIPPRRRGEGDI